MSWCWERLQVVKQAQGVRLLPGNRSDDNLPDIPQDFPIEADAGSVFDAVSSVEGVDHWWTETCSGQARPGASFDLGFGPGYQWRAEVTKCIPRAQFELTLTPADPDWMGTQVGFELSPIPGGTQVRFYHRGCRWRTIIIGYRATAGHSTFACCGGTSNTPRRYPTLAALRREGAPSAAGAT